MRNLAQQWRQAASGVDVVVNEPDWGSTFVAVASDGGEVVGKCSLWVRDDGWGFVERVYVTPSHRRRGIASQMLQTLLDHTGATLRTRGIGETSPSGAAFLSGFSGDDVPSTWGTDGRWEDWLRTAVTRHAYDEVARAAYRAQAEFQREHPLDNKSVIPSTLQMWLDRVGMGWATDVVVWSDERIDTDGGFVGGRTRHDPLGLDSQITLYSGGGRLFTLLHELAHLRYPHHGEEWAKEFADLLRKAVSSAVGDTWIRTYRKHQRIKASASVSGEFDTIDAIRERHGANENPRVCAHVARDIERELGYPTVTGFYRGHKSGRRLWAQHVWNVLPDGSILDATADQWGLDPITVAPRGDERWDPLSPEQQRWLDGFVRQHRKSPTMNDWAFWDSEF